jgi:hypothetical protein
MMMSGGLDPLQHDNTRLSAGSATSLLSDDSGYASTSAETEMPIEREQPILVEKPISKTENRRLFGLSAIFKRRERLTVETQSGGVSLASQTTTPISITLEVSEAEPLTRYDIREPMSRSTANDFRECVSCLDDFATAEVITLSCHSYCHECFTRLIRYSSNKL